MPLMVREVSDLHTEFQMRCYTQLGMMDFVKQVLPVLSTDKDTVLLVAGDLGTAKATRLHLICWFLEIVAKRFKHVFYVLGNHEHYGSVLEETHDKIVNGFANRLAEAKRDKLFSKVTIAGNDPLNVMIDDWRFLIGTMWTNYGGDGEYGDKARSVVARCLNDHHLITTEDDNGKLRVAMPEVMREVFINTIAKFGTWLQEGNNDKTIIVTHHLPSFDVVDAKYKNDEVSRLMNHGFASDLNVFIAHHKPRAWFFGHTHTPFNSMIASTRVICNPYGYENEANFVSGRFDPKAVHHFDSHDSPVQAS